MLFNSAEFIVFFVIYFFLNLFIPSDKKVYLVIIGSSIFYLWWKPIDLWVPYFLIFISFFGYKIIHKNKGNKRILALASVLSILYLPLIIFKYYGFFYNELISPLFNLNIINFKTNIPLGISFITFTLTAFLVDIFKNKFVNKFNLLTFMAYILYFPQLIAGPILRPNELIPQLQEKQKKITNFLFPITIFTIGLVKKVLFADYISNHVDKVFSSEIITNNFLDTLLAVYGFSMQIYCDFSGYTDMAIGSSLLLGINLPLNFLNPYKSESLTNFWRSWHITLSDFLKDYIYIPLGGNRFGFLSQARNLFITMLIGGLWHGASWGFIIWGALHGIGLSILSIKRKFLKNDFLIPRSIGIFLTFNFVTYTWVFFRAPSLEKAYEIFNQLSKFNLDDLGLFISTNFFPISLIIIFLFLHKWDNFNFIKTSVKKIPKQVLIPILFVLWLVVISSLSKSTGAFIYFDF